jgi:hypothetical protein
MGAVRLFAVADDLVNRSGCTLVWGVAAVRAQAQLAMGRTANEWSPSSSVALAQTLAQAPVGAQGPLACSAVPLPLEAPGACSPSSSLRGAQPATVTCEWASKGVRQCIGARSRV